MLTLDAEDKALPKQNTPGLVKEETFVRKLTQKQRANLRCKRNGIHNCSLPLFGLDGLGNMTHRGMLGNSESLSKNLHRKRPGWLQSTIDQRHAFSTVQWITPLVLWYGLNRPRFQRAIEDNLPNHSLHELSLDHQEPQDGVKETERLFSVGTEIPRTMKGNERFLNQSEYMSLQWELGAFEKEFRRFLLSYYQHYALHVHDWEECGVDPLSENWHKLIHVARNDKTLNKKASSTIKGREFVPSDIPGGKYPIGRI